MTKERFYRHGDVYIIEASKKASEVRKGKRVESMILAYGEVTGHKHELVCEPGQVEPERYEVDGKTFLIVGPKGVSITHEEHGLGFIEPGVHEIRIDREYDYLTEMQRPVSD